MMKCGSMMQHHTIAADTPVILVVEYGLDEAAMGVMDPGAAALREALLAQLHRSAARCC